eukprot:536877-Amorphochlora_amoeboformis.AAC.1
MLVSKLLGSEVLGSEILDSSMASSGMGRVGVSHSMKEGEGHSVTVPSALSVATYFESFS